MFIPASPGWFVIRVSVGFEIYGFREPVIAWKMPEGIPVLPMNEEFGIQAHDALVNPDGAIISADGEWDHYSKFTKFLSQEHSAAIERGEIAEQKTRQ